MFWISEAGLKFDTGKYYGAWAGWVETEDSFAVNTFSHCYQAKDLELSDSITAMHFREAARMCDC